MPTYTYLCPYCVVGGNRFEKVQSVENRQVATCPKCGKVAPLIISKISGHFWRNPLPLYHKDGSYEEKY